jgi:hypothetical protein
MVPQRQFQVKAEDDAPVGARPDIRVLTEFT